MKHDPFYNQIINGLNGKLDPDIFEACVVELLRDEGHAAVPIPGGDDAGMDGAIMDGEGEPFPLVTTIGSDCIGNLTRNLERYKKCGGKRTKVIFATSQSLTQKRRNNLNIRASELGFIMVQLYEQQGIANLLYRNPKWCKELLGLSGSPSALSVFPLPNRTYLKFPLIGREQEYTWIKETNGDRLLVGEPGCGKTALLAELAQESDSNALFVINKDRKEIANALREQQPKVLMIDDAHVEPDFLIELRHLRAEIHAEFEILATCWNGEMRLIADKLNLPGEKVRVLDRLSRDQIVEVIANTGIKGVNWLVREIVNQAEGLPGLAVTLTSLCLKGDTQRVVNAQFLIDTVLNFYVQNTSSEIREILAAFSIGGDGGIEKSIVSRELGVGFGSLTKALASLAAGGVIAEVGNNSDYIKVRPAALRQALIRDVFFSGSAALPKQTLQTLLLQTLDLNGTIVDLINAKARGGNVPSRLLQGYLYELPGNWQIWREYAWLGHDEANWVIDHFQGPMSEIAEPLLEKAPEKIIPLMLNQAIGDARALHSTPSHPLRQLSDWIQSAYPTSPQVLERRRIILDAARKWMLDHNNPNIGYRVILMALDPRFELALSDPGAGDTMTIHSAYLTADEIRELNSFWQQIMELTDEIEVPDWQPFLDMIGEYIYSYHKKTEDIREVLKSFALQMTADVAAKAQGNPRALYGLRQLIDRLDSDITITLDPEIEILYPSERDTEDHKRQEAQWQRNVEELAVKWKGRHPSQNVQRIKEIEEQMSPPPYPRLIPSLCRYLADLTDDPLQYVTEILQTEISSDILFSFLNRTVNLRQDGWESIAQECFGRDEYDSIVTRIILRLENSPTYLKQEALRKLSKYPDIADILYLRQQLPDQLLPELLSHSDPRVAASAALAEWQTEPKGSVRDWLKEEWENTLVNYCNDDHWLKEIFVTHSHLAFDWLKIRLTDEKFESFRFREGIPAAISVLTLDQRRQIMEILPAHFDEGGIVSQLVGSSLELYRELLQSEQLRRFHLSPLGGHINAVWEEMAKMAVQAGYSAEKIAGSTMRPEGYFSWVGNQSDLWKSWLDRFHAISQHTDITIRQIGKVGRKYCQQRYDECIRRERHEAVYGRDW